MKKSIKPTASTRLGDKPKGESIGLKPKRTCFNPTSFRLTNDDIQDLRQITKQVNELSRSKISDTKVVQALIQLAKNINPLDLYDAIKILV